MKKILSLILIAIILITQLSFIFAYYEEEYYVQVGAFNSQTKAEKYNNYMVSIGYESVLIKVYDLHKVFLGPYDSEEAAREILLNYRSVGGSGFFVIGSQMYYHSPKEELKEVTEADAVEATEEAVEEASEEAIEEAVEEASEEANEEAIEEAIEEVKAIETEKSDYKLFTIILIVMLWVLFIIILVVFRLNQNKSSIN